MRDGALLSGGNAPERSAWRVLNALAFGLLLIMVLIGTNFKLCDNQAKFSESSKPLENWTERSHPTGSL
jgi:hypothetical protein